MWTTNSNKVISKAFCNSIFHSKAKVSPLKPMSNFINIQILYTGWCWIIEKYEIFRTFRRSFCHTGRVSIMLVFSTCFRSPNKDNIAGKSIQNFYISIVEFLFVRFLENKNLAFNQNIVVMVFKFCWLLCGISSQLHSSSFMLGSADYWKSFPTR